MSETSSSESAGQNGDVPPLAADSSQFDVDSSRDTLQAEAIRRANGGRGQRAFLAEMAADLETWFLAQGLIEEAERQRQARAILETPVEAVFDSEGVESLLAHDRLMYRYYRTMGNPGAAEVHRAYLSARGEAVE